MKKETNRDKAYRLFKERQNILIIQGLFREWGEGIAGFRAEICEYDGDSGYIPNTEATRAINSMAREIWMELDKKRIAIECEIGELIKEDERN